MKFCLAYEIRVLMVLPHYVEKEKNICGTSGDNRVVPQMRQKNSVLYLRESEYYDYGNYSY